MWKAGSKSSWKALGLKGKPAFEATVKQGTVVVSECDNGLGMDALVTVCSWNTIVIMMWAWMLQSPHALGPRTLLWFGHGCSSHRMLWEHERYYGLGMDALVTVCSGNTNVILVWAWML